MSIIHDALKKVQQSLTPKIDEAPVPPSGTTPKGSTYLYASPPPIETLTPAKGESAHLKIPVQNKIKTILVFICAMLITGLSLWYIYLQFRQNIPQVKRFAKTSFYHLIHKEQLPDFKTRSPADLKPLAQLTINPSTITPSTQAATPLTLNIHGIMSNARGNLALINDHVYQEGDDIDGAKIVKINLDSIMVNINGTEKTILVKN